MTNGTTGDERYRKVLAGLAFRCESSGDALWANNSVSNQEKIYSL
jgi:hypothetical protein